MRFAAAAAALTAVVSVAGFAVAHAGTTSGPISITSNSSKTPSLTPTLTSGPTSSGTDVPTIPSLPHPTGTSTTPPTSTKPSGPPITPTVSPLAPAPTIIQAGMPVVLQVTGSGRAQSIVYSAGFGAQTLSDQPLPWTTTSAAVGSVSVTAVPAGNGSVGCRITQGSAVLAFQPPRAGSVTCQGFTAS